MLFTGPSNKDFLPSVNILLVLGDFGKYHEQIAKKLLLLCFSSMMSNSLFNSQQRTEMSHHIYKTLRAITGRYGMELRRTCGSSGLVAPQTDIDLLDTLHTNKGNLPRSVHGTVIIKGADRYWIIWKSTSNSEKRFTFTYYSPPKRRRIFPNASGLCSHISRSG